MLPSHAVPAGELVQHVSRTRYRGSSFHFGAAATNRYDAPDGSYGVLYLAHDLPTALMESMFHKHRWSRSTMRTVALTEVRARMVRLIEVIEPLVLADLTASGVMAGDFGLNLHQLTSRNFVHTQRTSKRVHAMVDASGLPRFDGIFYPSRNNFPANCIALFDRASAKVNLHTDLDLDQHVGWPPFVARYRIGVVA